MSTATQETETQQRDTTPGIFSWNELVTQDTSASAKFYSQLFGWASENMEMDGGGTYTVFKAGGRPAAGMMTMPSEAGGTESFWMGYVTVPNLKDAVAQAKRLGAKICKDATPIPGMGSFAVITDPQGAGLGLWEFAK